MHPKSCPSIVLWKISVLIFHFVYQHKECHHLDREVPFGLITRCKLQGISWFLLVHPIISTISNFYCIFLLMEGLHFGWVIVLFGRDYPDPFIILISLILYSIHYYKFSGWNIKWLNVKVIINEQSMTISPLYWCIPS